MDCRCFAEIASCVIMPAGAPTQLQNIEHFYRSKRQNLFFPVFSLLPFCYQTNIIK